MNTAEWIGISVFGAAAVIGGFFAFKKKKKPIATPTPVPPTPVSDPHPVPLNWPDRRPIGMVMLSNHREHLPGNKNWMNDNMPLAHWLEQHARNCLINMANFQGMIVWDPEGSEFPRPFSYMGDPELVPDYIDKFFAQFKGFRTGICVRPDVIKWVEGWPRHFIAEDPAQNLIDKIAYAKKRWGCSLFYIDSNVGYGMQKSADNTVGAGGVLPVSFIERVHKAHPDVLLIPEWGDEAYHYYSAPLNNHNRSHLVPRGFQVLNVADTKWNDWQIKESVKQGNILMGRVWWNAPELKIIKDAYDS